MLPASNRGAGQCIGFPDICNTPVGPATVPVPYVNVGMNAQSQGFSQIVKVSGVNALNIGSVITTTMGDEPGSAHPTIKGPVTFTMGDVIVSIDRLPGVRLTSLTTQNNMNNTVGAVVVPSAVNVTYCRRGEDKSDDALCLATRATARPLPGGVALVQLPHFGADSVASLYAALRSVCPHGVRSCRGLVIDLRDNPGGELEAAVALAGCFLPRGAVVARLEDAGGRRTFTSRDGELGMPLAVLIDGRTASAAELFAASLHEHGRALLVGTTSYGKAEASRDGAPGRWSTGSGRSVSQRALSPDIVAQGDDAQRLAWAHMVATAR